MTFEEAKQRSDYKFRLNGIENLIDDIRNNCMKDLYPENEPYLSEAVLEIGYMDVEVNIYAYCQCSDKADSEDKRPVIDYFTCIKTGDGDYEWDLGECLNRDVRVDWNADNWTEQLERDMFEALDEYVDMKGYSYDHANVIGGKMHTYYLYYNQKRTIVSATSFDMVYLGYKCWYLPGDILFIEDTCIGTIKKYIV